MVSHPRDYAWSSYRANAEGVRLNLHTPHAEYERLGETAETRLKAYNGLFAEELDSRLADEIRVATNGGFALGNESFQQRISVALGRRAERGSPGRPAMAGSGGTKSVPSQQLLLMPNTEIK